ncbi:MAG: DUF805 domain-containing protein [Pseudomonadota bacterium]|nr:DUF805 domain-containing protein [Pseudomonadota bacterium]
MKLRPLFEKPFRNYAVFSGRAGRNEFWLFILTFAVITQLAWLVGFGALKIAGFDRNDDGASIHHMMGLSEYGDSEYGNTERDDPDGAQVDVGSAASGSQTNGGPRPEENRPEENRPEENRPEENRENLPSGMSGRNFPDRDDDDVIRFTIHRHGGNGYHLHGIMRDNHMLGHDRDDPDDSDDHGRYEYRGDHRDGYHRNRYLYVKFHKSRAERGGDVLWMISVAALLLPLFAVGARRLHDSNHSGWWQLLMLIPLAGWLVLAIFFLLPSDAQENRFGPTP